MQDYYISIDIGGTAIKYGVLDCEGKIIEKSSLKTNVLDGGIGIIHQISQIIKNTQNTFELKGIAISTAGMVDYELGKIIYSGELIPNYTGTEIKKVIEEMFSLPCTVENDVNCAGLAEVVSGVAKGCKDVVCLTVGTGIGGCIILDGKVFHGRGNCAGEVGYMNMEGSDFQTLGATSILCKKVAQRKQESIEAWNGVRVFECAKKNDIICVNAIREMTDILGKGIANICYVLNPEMVVLGGGIMAQQEVIRPLLNEALEKYLRPILLEQTKIVFAEQGNNAGMLGAFYNFMEKNKESN